MSVTLDKKQPQGGDTCTCGAWRPTVAKLYDHLMEAHGLTGPSRSIPPAPDTFTVSPRGLADQFGLPTYEGE